MRAPESSDNMAVAGALSMYAKEVMLMSSLGLRTLT